MSPFGAGSAHMRSVLGKGGAAWTPNLISDCVLWLDANQITGLSDGDVVGTWSDLSGNSADLSQATASKKPLYKTGIINSKPTVRFDGTDDYLQGALAATATQPTTIVIVVKGIAWSGLDAVLDGDDSTNRQLIHETAASKWGIWAGTTLATATQPDTSAHVLTCLFNGASSYIRVDGTATTGNANTRSIDGVTLGTSYDGAANYKSNVDIAEVVIYDAQISTANRTLLEAHLGTKYNVTIA